MKKLVFFTGAGMSRESGMPTFRGEGGIWGEIDPERVASASNWYSGRRSDCRERRQAMLDFFNPMRRAVIDHEPNEGHRLIASLEKDYDVTVITQNGDDFHSRAGSTDVIYLHGEALKNASSARPYEPLPIDLANPDIHLGDRAEDGSQLRPFVIYFGEDIDKRLWRRAVKAVKEADAMVVVGSTMLVYPAADLVARLRRGVPLWVIDPMDVELPEGAYSAKHIRAGATEGLKILIHDLKEI